MRDQNLENNTPSRGSENDTDVNNVPHESTTIPPPCYPATASPNLSNNYLPSYFEQDPPRYTIFAVPNARTRHHHYADFARVAFDQIGVRNFPGVAIPMIPLARPEEERLDQQEPGTRCESWKNGLIAVGCGLLVGGLLALALFIPKIHRSHK